MKFKSTPSEGMKVKGEFLHLRSCVITLNLCLCYITRPGNNSNLSRDLGLAAENFLQKCGICDTYDH